MKWTPLISVYFVICVQFYAHICKDKVEIYQNSFYGTYVVLLDKYYRYIIYIHIYIVYIYIFFTFINQDYGRRLDGTFFIQNPDSSMKHFRPYGSSGRFRTHAPKRLVFLHQSLWLSHKGPSINYVGKILPIFDPPPLSIGKFTT